MTFAAEPVGGGHGNRRETHPTLTHSLAEVNAAQSSAKGATSTSNPHRGRDLGAKPRTPPWTEGQAKINTRWVGNDSAGTRPDTLDPRRPLLSHHAVLRPVHRCFRALAPTHAFTVVVDTHSGGQGDCSSSKTHAKQAFYAHTTQSTCHSVTQ